MNGSVTRSATIGVTSVAAASAARWLNGSGGSLSSSSMITLAAVGAGSAYVAPSVAAAVYKGAGRGLVEAVVSGSIAAAALYLYTGDSSVAMHIPVQALAHIGGSVIAKSISAPSAAYQQPMGNAPASPESVADLAAAIA